MNPTAAEIENGDTVADFHDEVHVVLDDEQRHIEIGVEATQLLRESFDFLVRQTPCRFVQQKEARC